MNRCNRGPECPACNPRASRADGWTDGRCLPDDERVVLAEYSIEYTFDRLGAHNLKRTSSAYSLLVRRAGIWHSVHPQQADKRFSPENNLLILRWTYVGGVR